MKKAKEVKLIMLFAVSTLLLIGCNNNDKNTNENPENPQGNCSVHLFDGDNFKDDNFVLKGPGEFSSLKNLPGADKDWSDEADALKVGSSAKVTVWNEENFQGESKVFNGGDEVAKLQIEIRSIKINCN